MLDVEEIQRRLSPATDTQLGTLTLLDSVDSSNSWLLRRCRGNPSSGWVCISEHQTHGKGRHGRRWVSPFGSSVYLSLLWRFLLTPMELQGLSLAIGIAVRRALEEVGAAEVALKWPNDLEYEGGKLAGVLLEMKAEAGGPSMVVIGIGVNVELPPEEAGRIDRPWADMANSMGCNKVSRNGLVAVLLKHLVEVLRQFEEARFAPFVEEWVSADPYCGKPVVLLTGERCIKGVHSGIDRDGALLLNTGGQTQRFVAGEMSLRPVD
ncbi:MAG TPA: biotin--[acetyl-CoA-carboxylase] ligase [Chromatiales bacterium]|nr:biotin--[acetyl-CoA-carboxylase] ligase [Chromatiales bacterium]